MSGAREAGTHVHEHGVAEAGMVEVEPATGVLPAHVEAEALDSLAVGQALEALEHHHHGHDHRWHGAPADVGEEVGEGLVGEERPHSRWSRA